MMTSRNTWRERMLADLIVAGLSERTQIAYLRAVRQLSEYYNGTQPEQQVKDYLLWMRTEKRASENDEASGREIPDSFLATRFTRRSPAISGFVTTVF